jgi:hypothetical protein
MVVKPALVKPGDTLGERSRGAVPGPVRELDKWARRRPAPMARGARAGPAGRSLGARLAATAGNP